MTQAETGSGPWPVRAWVLTLIGACAGLAIYLLLEDAGEGWPGTLRLAGATFIGTAALIFGHGWVPGHGRRAALTGLVGGAVIALVFLWNGAPTERWSAGAGWRVVAALLSVSVLVPLVQAAGDAGAGWPRNWRPAALKDWARAHLPYAAVYEHGWTNVLTAGLSLAFAGLFFLMLLLLGELFDLIDIDLLKEWLREEGVAAAIGGGAIGASTGLLRDRGRILSAFQGVVMVVLRVAAPVVAAALLIFLAALLFTGLTPLWDATRATTPIVLGVAILALLLVNSVIGDAPEDAARARPFRWAAIGLALALLPLSIIAAISTGLRVGQYGWTPERLWAAVFVGMSCVTALTYVLAVARGRGWAERLRGANLWLAVTICGLAFLLSTPLLSFDGIATRDQITRLRDGRIAPVKFDYQALWFDFGPAGKAAVRELARSGRTAEIRRYAAEVQRLNSRWDEPPNVVAARSGRELDERLTVVPAKVPLPVELRAALVGHFACGPSARCTLHYRPGDEHAVTVREPEADCRGCDPAVGALLRKGKAWVNVEATTAEAGPRLRAEARARAIRQGQVEVRTESYRRLYIGGEPFGPPFPVEGPQAP